MNRKNLLDTRTKDVLTTTSLADVRVRVGNEVSPVTQANEKRSRVSTGVKALDNLTVRVPLKNSNGSSAAFVSSDGGNSGNSFFVNVQGNGSTLSLFDSSAIAKSVIGRTGIGTMNFGSTFGSSDIGPLLSKLPLSRPFGIKGIKINSNSRVGNFSITYVKRTVKGGIVSKPYPIEASRNETDEQTKLFLPINKGDILTFSGSEALFISFESTASIGEFTTFDLSMTFYIDFVENLFLSSK